MIVTFYCLVPPHFVLYRVIIFDKWQQHCFLFSTGFGNVFKRREQTIARCQRNIVGSNMLRASGHHVATRCPNTLTEPKDSGCPISEDVAKIIWGGCQRLLPEGAVSRAPFSIILYPPEPAKHSSHV